MRCGDLSLISSTCLFQIVDLLPADVLVELEAALPARRRLTVADKSKKPMKKRPTRTRPVRNAP